MNIRRLLRQLQILLWKNYTLRKRKKIRLCAEIIWPLFLFIILVIVRFTRIFEQKNGDCYFVERPLPSYGLLPFFRTFICELDYSCYNRSVDNNYDEDFYKNFKNISLKIKDLISKNPFQLTSLIESLMLNNSFLNSSQLFNNNSFLSDEQNITQFVNNNNTANLIHQFCQDLIELQFNGTALCDANITQVRVQILGIIKPIIRDLLDKLQDIDREFNDILKNTSISKAICGNSNRNIFQIINDILLSNSPNSASKTLKSTNFTSDNLFKNQNGSVNTESSYDFCTTLKSQVNSTIEGRFLYNRVSVFLSGKILYTPNKPVYNDIIRRMNSTFETIDNFWKLFFQLDTLTNQLIEIQAQLGIDYFTSIKENENFLIIKTVSSFMKNLFGCMDLNKFIGYDSEDAAIAAAGLRIANDTFWTIIVFDDSSNGTKVPDQLTYKIRMTSTESRNTFFTKTREYKYGPNNCIWCNVEFVNGFIYIQDLLEKSIIEERTNESYGFGITTQMTPYPCYAYDVFTDSISQSLPLLMVIAWIFTVSMTVKDIVYEKEKRLKEFMRVMGLTNGIHWLAWFITSFVIIITISVFLSIILKYGRILPKAEFSVLIVFLTCFVLATITQCFLISVFFNRANLAAAAGGIIYFLLYLPYIVLTNFASVVEVYQIGLVSLSSTVGFGYGCSIISAYELQGVGVNWKNFYEIPLAAKNGVTLNFFCLILLCDSFIYMILAWYIENVWPGEFGRGLSFYFPIQPSYWCGKSFAVKYGLTINGKAKIKKIKHNLENEEVDPVVIEPTEFSSENNVGIEINDLHKIYSRGNTYALKGLTLKFYQNEITSFLGHNGAGKSTTMHILTGLYSSTKGSAKINGLDVNTEIDKIRKSLGFVPQYNILFDDMSVINHLWFYARLKGVSACEIKLEIKKILVDTGLEEKKNELAKTLSGGMQRKLSVAIAFVGGSKTVILDEPSAGVDPSGRRGIWDLLFKYRKGRTIIISTHHIDEADILGDRIAMIANGRLIAYATSFYLKCKFGRGYYLTIAKKRDDSSETDSTKKKTILSESVFEISSKKNSLDSVENELLEVEQQILLTTNVDDHVNKFIKSRINKAILVKNNISEMVYSIPNQPEYTRKYGDIFLDLEANMEALKIDSIGLSDTSLEEIFIRMAKQATKNKTINCSCCQEGLLKRCITCLKYKNSDYEKNELTINEIDETFSKYTTQRVNNKFQLFTQQLYSLLVKRFYRVKRNKRGFCAEIILPIIFVCLALLVASLRPKTLDMPSLELHPWLFADQNYIFYRKYFDLETEAINLPIVEKITNTFFEKPSIGNRCIKNHVIEVTDHNYYSISSKVTKKLKCNELGITLARNLSTPSNIQEVLNGVNYSYTKIAPSCSCETGLPICPTGSDGDINYRFISKLITTDTLIDLTERNISDWLLKTEVSETYFQKRYGGFDFSNNREKNRITNQINSLLMSLTNGKLEILTNKAKIWYNNFGVFAHVSFLNTLNNAIYREKLKRKENIDTSNIGIISINHPLPYNKIELSQQNDYSIGNEIFVAICILFALSFIPASFLIFIVDERTSNSKQLQFVSGIKPFIYWLANYLWDLLNYLVPCSICIILFIIFDVKAYTCENNFASLICLLLIYGWAAIAFVYPFNYVFKLPSTAFVQISCLNIFIGVCTTISTTVIDQLSVNSPSLSQTNNIMKTVFLVLMPQYCLCRGILDLSIQYYSKLQKYRLLGLTITYSGFEFDIIGKNLLALFGQGIVFFLFNLLIEYRFFIQCKPSKAACVENPEDEDDDVHMERIRVKSLNDNKKWDLNNGKDYLRLINVTKVYTKMENFKVKKHTAVQSLYLGVDKGECFGLIGVNGAGKTTTFKMLTGSLSMSSGDAYLNGHSVTQDIEKVHQDIGYCPQTDAIFPLLTAREHLYFYARIRGIPEKFVSKVCKWALKRVDLEVFENFIAGDYSGGNKRKLSTAIALVGNPSCIYLDEPTSGMDAKVRRLLWKDITNLVKDNRIVILTSHNMDECEALCTRLVIMVDGKFKCLGSPQHLKSKFGTGYKISMRFDENTECDRNKLISFLEVNFLAHISSSCINKRLFEFTISFKETKLSTLFNIIESNRNEWGLQDYSITQSTLDSIFVNFACQQSIDKDALSAQKKIRTKNSDEENYKLDEKQIDFQSGIIVDEESINTEITYL